jgi:peroxiredoxin
MAALETPQATIGWSARPFSLKGVDGKTYTLNGVKGPRGLLVMFICNHCPFVQAVIGQIIRDTRELKEHGIGSVAIMSNDTEDSFDNMRRWAKEKAFPFPYLLDATQEVAKAYGAVCTPDFSEIRSLPGSHQEEACLLITTHIPSSNSLQVT